MHVHLLAGAHYVMTTFWPAAWPRGVEKIFGGLDRLAVDGDDQVGGRPN